MSAGCCCSPGPRPRDASSSLWISDGTAGGTHALSAAGSVVYPDAYAAVAGGRIVFENQEAADQTLASSLWVTDGTQAGTQPLAVPGWTAGIGFDQFVSFQGQAVFSGTNGLWISDGTASGTHQLLAGSGAGPTDASSLTILGDLLVFAGDRCAGRAVAVGGPTAPMPEPEELLPAGADASGLSPANMTVLGDHILFSAADASGQIGLWITDGTASGTVEIPVSGSSAGGLDPVWPSCPMTAGWSSPVPIRPATPDCG